LRWLKGKDYSYATKKDYARSRMLADFGQGGLVMVSDPVTSNDETLPGYHEWMLSKKDKAENKGQRPLLYAQTNDGLLRIIDPSSPNNGKELKAILPPPLLIPSRLASLKAGLVGDKRQWINISGATGNKSYPAFTLDGSLQTRNFDLQQKGESSSWGQYLLGTLGRGGNGLYMVDVSSRENPRAMWYRENAGGKLIRGNWTDKSGSTLVHAGADLIASGDADLGYLQLGFNSPKPVMGVAPASDGKTMQNFIALAGGVQSQVPFDKSQNGKEGAVLLFIEPKDGKVIKAFTGESLKDAAWRVGSGVTGKAPYMGMMVSRPVAVRSAKNKYLTGSVIAADNRGNIFRVEMEDREGGIGYDPSKWTIKTLATLQEDADKDSSDKSYSIPDGVVVTMENGGDSLWIAGGTSDTFARKGKDDPNDAGVIANERQMIFSFAPNLKTDAKPLTRDDLKEIKTESQGGSGGITAGGGEERGWRIMLKGRGQNNGIEYVSAKPLLVNGVLFVATFIPKVIATSDSSLCAAERAVAGDARIYAVDIRSGKPGYWEAEPGEESPVYQKYPDTKIDDIEMVGDKILATTDPLPPSPPSDDKEPIILDPPPGGSRSGGFQPATTLINYWMMS
jgi:Tfp pilus tip-associated adhesin PilY1